MLQKTLRPGEECLFYVGVLFLCQEYGVPRAGFVLKGEDMFYRISGIDPQHDPVLIPCGKIVLKK
jgi:hypothetical protein